MYACIHVFVNTIVLSKSTMVYVLYYCRKYCSTPTMVQLWQYHVCTMVKIFFWVDTFFSFLFLLSVGVLGHNRLPFGWNLSLRDTPEWLCGLENVSRASVDGVVNSKRVKNFNSEWTIPLKIWSVQSHLHTHTIVTAKSPHPHIARVVNVIMQSSC